MKTLHHIRVYALITVLLIAILPLSPVIAQTEVLDADDATLNITITNTVGYSGGSAEEIEARLSWYPREEYNQQVKSLSAEPTARRMNEELIFLWSNPQRQQNLKVTGEVRTSNEVKQITTRVPFPLEEVPVELAPYTLPTKMIDTNEDIRRLASELAAGKNDQYEVVFALADWVTTNIDYELTSVTADAVYPSSWVLENGYGVCDEMTNLFLSLNRALGIPARFVSGLSYTNLPELNTEWGGHGWAEVYFPGYGWVPFDTTYGEYGYVDAGHIKLKDSVTSEENSIEFTARGRNFQLQTQPLDFAVEVAERHERPGETITAGLRPYTSQVGAGSYNLLTLTLRNRKPYYVSTRVDLSRTTQTSHESPDQVNVLLKPRQEKELYFLVKVDDNLQAGYQYTFPFAAYTKLGAPAETSFSGSTSGQRYSKSTFDKYFVKQEGTPAAIGIECDAPKNAKVGPLDVTCTFTNNEPRSFSKLKLCVAETCALMPLAKGASKTVNTTITYTTPGIYNVPATVTSSEATASRFYPVSVLDETLLAVESVELPATITYNEKQQLKFLVSRTSQSVPVAVRTRVEHEKFTHKWDSEELLNAQEYTLTFRGNNLDAGENTIKIIIEYDDAFGETHTVVYEQPIALINLSFGQKVTLWLDKLTRVFG